MPIETRSWQNISREHRICHLFSDGVGDEYHYLFLCTNEAVFEIKTKILPKYYHLNPYINKMGGILSLCNVKLLCNIAVFGEQACLLTHSDIHICIYHGW
jgi:hypothetical protein